MKITLDKADLATWKDSHEIMAGAISPRPIAWISTVGPDGRFNVAPFSFCCPMITKPMILGFNVASRRDGSQKTTISNIQFSRDFVYNVVTEALTEKMNLTSTERPKRDKFNIAKLTPAKADMVKSPLVAESPINLECRLVQILEFGDAPSGDPRYGQGPRRAQFVIGEVVRVHVEKDLYVNKEIDTSKLKAIARMGGSALYCRTSDTFLMPRPEDPYA